MTFNGELLNQTSDQNRVREPFSTTNLQLLAKAEETESVEVIRDVMSLQIQDNLLLKIGKPFSNTGLNLLNIIFFHSSLLGRESLQIHLKNIALFLAINDPIPRPPLSLSLTTTLHWTS